MILCHRGIYDYYPENTIGSITEAIVSPNYDGVEIDIQVTKDNKWIIYHDHNLLRLNSINNDIKDINFNDINKIEWKGKKFCVNILSDLEQLHSYHNFILNIEIKPTYNETSYEAKIELKKILKKFRFKNFLSSFDHDWFDWSLENTRVEFASITENVLPIKGSFWILDYRLLDKIDLFDIMEKNIKIGCYGNLMTDIDDKGPLKYQIVDDKKRKVVYVDGAFDLLNTGHIDFFNKAKSHGNYLIVGVLDDSCVESYKRVPILSLEERTNMLENIKIVDKVISPAPFYKSKFGDLTKSFIQKNEIDHVIYAGELGSWNTHYQSAIDMKIMTTISYDNNNLSTSEIIRRVKKI